MKHSPACILFLTLALSGPASADEIVARQAMSPGQWLAIKNRSGSIEITGWDRQEIEVIGDVSGRESRIDIEDRGSKVYVQVTSRGGRPGRADLQIRVPTNTKLEISGVSSDIEVDNITGTQKLSSVSGDIASEMHGADLLVNTVSGSIEIVGHEQSASLEMSTVSGDAEAKDVSGEIHATTTSGTLEVDGSAVDRLSMNSISGDIDFAGELQNDARVDLETVNGDVMLDIQDGLEAAFDLESFNGYIASIDGVESKRKSRYGPGRYLDYVRGSGSARVRINTLNGDIEVVSD